jgi:hypothetical protein
MFSFPLIYLLIPFGIIVLLAALFFFFNIFHLKRYAIQSRATTLVMLAYGASFIAIMLIIGGYVSSIDWSKDIVVSDIVPRFNNVNPFEERL